MLFVSYIKQQINRYLKILNLKYVVSTFEEWTTNYSLKWQMTILNEIDQHNSELNSLAFRINVCKKWHMFLQT